MIKRKVAPVVASTALLVLISATSAVAVAGSISNGDFEVGVEGDTTVSGWTSVNSRVDLGVDTIAGCTTVDTSDYTTLRDYDANWINQYGGSTGVITNQNPTVNADSMVGFSLDGEVYTTTMLNSATTFGNPAFARTGNVLELYSDLSSTDSLGGNAEGYVVHGPAVYSEAFTARTIDDLKLDWAAAYEEDDFHVFGYLLNTVTCAQTEVIDATGDESLWQTSAVAVPVDGTYRFVFVSGSFDYSFGGAAGAYLYLDNIVLTVNEERKKELAETGANVEWLTLGSLIAVVAGASFFALGRRKPTA